MTANGEARVRLTKDARACLLAMPDWSAPYEVRDRIGCGRIRTVERICRSLTREGLAKHSPANNTFRVTSAGRAALENADEQ